MTYRCCNTRLLKTTKKTKAKAKGLFSGTLYPSQFTFKTPKGSHGVSQRDTQTAISYALKVSRIIQQYCSQYGMCSLAVNPSPIAKSVSLRGQTYSDADLQTWVDEIVSQNGISQEDCVIILNPHSGVENSDAPVSQGVLGYHSISAKGNAYVFVNTMGSNFTVADTADVYAMALSHEIGEMTVDPKADGSNPEVCDPCAGNCSVDYRDYFDSNGDFIAGKPSSWAFFINGIAAPAESKSCPADKNACQYPPPR